MPCVADGFRLSLLEPSACLKEASFAVQNPFSDHAPLEDMMNGVIDLLFWHNEKIYIADWKTNWLPNYENAAMESEMEANAYRMQAAIYADAVQRFLWQRDLPASCFGGVLYIFVRAFTADAYRESDEPEATDAGLGIYFMDSVSVAVLASRYQIGVRG
jgi:ATP-dependent exoDNAse (exonuclease V) beta subunit